MDPCDRGTAYGDGVFRTLLVRDGRLVCWERHYRKLLSDCQAISVACPSRDTLEAELAWASEDSRRGAAKIIVTRGPGSRGYAPPANPKPSRLVSVGPLPSFPQDNYTEGVCVHRCRMTLGFQPRLAGIKHLNRLENVLARSEWSSPNFAEGLLLDAEDHVVEGVASNLFVVREGKLHTPDLSRCGISGVTRERVIDRLLEEGVPLRVAAISWAELVTSEEVVLVNSLIGAWQVRKLESHTWVRGRWASRIRSWLDESEV